MTLDDVSVGKLPGEGMGQVGWNQAVDTLDMKLQILKDAGYVLVHKSELPKQEEAA